MNYIRNTDDQCCRRAGQNLELWQSSAILVPLPPCWRLQESLLPVLGVAPPAAHVCFFGGLRVVGQVGFQELEVRILILKDIDGVRRYH